MFKYDSPLMTGLRKLLNLILISVMWLLLCIPVITAGASTTAYYHTIDKYMKYDMGYAAPEFIKSFRQNFRTATLCWLFILGAMMICFLDLAAVTTLNDKYPAVGSMDVIFYILLVILTAYAMWTFGCVARFENTVKQTMRNALIFMIGFLPSTLAVLLLIGFTALVVWLIPITILIMPGVCVWFSSYLMEKVFRKYLEDHNVNEKETEDV